MTCTPISHPHPHPHLHLHLHLHHLHAYPSVHASRSTPSFIAANHIPRCLHRRPLAAPHPTRELQAHPDAPDCQAMARRPIAHASSARVRPASEIEMALTYTVISAHQPSIAPSSGRGSSVPCRALGSTPQLHGTSWLEGTTLPIHRPSTPATPTTPSLPTSHPPWLKSGLRLLS